MLLQLRSEEGDRLLLGDTFADQDEQALTNLFGAAFAQAVLALPGRTLVGPDRVRLRAASGEGHGRCRRLRRVRLPRSASAWRRNGAASGRRRPRRSSFEGLMRKYQVVVDPAVRPWLGPLASQAEVRP